MFQGMIASSSVGCWFEAILCSCARVCGSFFHVEKVETKEENVEQVFVQTCDFPDDSARTAPFIPSASSGAPRSTSATPSDVRDTREQPNALLQETDSVRVHRRSQFSHIPATPLVSSPLRPNQGSSHQRAADESFVNRLED